MLFFRGKQIPRCARDDRNGVVQTFPSAAQARPRAALPRPRIAIQPAGCRTMTPMPDTLPDWLAWIERQHPRPIDLGLEQIGRAACRERVWQYVSIPVAAVSLKKKNNNNR